MPKYRIVVSFVAVEEAEDKSAAIELGVKLLNDGYWDDDEAEIEAERIIPTEERGE